MYNWLPDTSGEFIQPKKSQQDASLSRTALTAPAQVVVVGRRSRKSFGEFQNCVVSCQDAKLAKAANTTLSRAAIAAPPEAVDASLPPIPDVLGSDAAWRRELEEVVLEMTIRVAAEVLGQHSATASAASR